MKGLIYTQINLLNGLASLNSDKKGEKKIFGANLVQEKLNSDQTKPPQKIILWINNEEGGARVSVELYKKELLEFLEKAD